MILVRRLARNRATLQLRTGEERPTPCASVATWALRLHLRLHPRTWALQAHSATKRRFRESTFARALFAMFAEQLPRRDLDTDASTGLPGICGECKVLVNSAFHSVLVAPLVANRRLTRVLSDADFSGTYTSSCAAYCQAMGMSCVGAWEGELCPLPLSVRVM